VNEVKYENQWERADYRRAMRRAYSVTPWHIGAILSFTLVGLGLYFLGSHISIVIWLFIVGVLVDVVVRLVVYPVQWWRRDPTRGERKQITINDKGFAIQSTSGTDAIPWSDFRRLRESADYYFLELKQQPMSIAVCKISLRAPEIEGAFRRIVRRNVASKFKPNSALDTPSDL